MSNVSETGNKAGLSYLAVQILEAILTAGQMLPPAELARVYHTQPGKIREIYQDLTFQQAYRTVVLGKHFYRLDDVIKSITDKAVEGHAAQQKLFLQLHGLIDAKNITNLTANQFNVGQSPEDVIAKRKELEDTLKREIVNQGKAVLGEIQFEDGSPQSIIDTDNGEVISDN